jgi:hypothetical protein
MRQAQPESNSDSMDHRNSQRRTLVIGAGLAVAALVAATVLHEPPQDAQTATDVAASSAATSPSATDAAKPHFERTDEPAVEESVNSYGG